MSLRLRVSEHPRIGPDRSELSEGVRSYPVGNYLIFYRIADKRVLIQRVLHGARELGDLFD